MNTVTCSPHVAPSIKRGGIVETMPCEPGSARKARLLVALALSAWDLDDLIDAAKLVVTELVSNAVENTKCHSIRVTVTRLAVGRVRLAVIDTSAKKAVPRTAAVDDEHGRGLAIVDAVAAATGTDAFAWGKRSWAEVAAPGTNR